MSMSIDKEFIVPAIGRSIETQTAYVRTMRATVGLGTAACILCERIKEHKKNGVRVRIGGRAIVLSNPHFLLIPNDFPYESYDGHRVLDHHMLVPREHLSSHQILANTTLRHARADVEAELQELAYGYYGTVMNRTDTSQASSVKNHAHWHYFHLGKPIAYQHFSIADQRNDVTYIE